MSVRNNDEIVRQLNDKQVVPLNLFFDEWSLCQSFKNQRDSWYRKGKLDNCSNQWTDMKKVFRAKLEKDKAKAHKMVKSTYYYRDQTTSPTVGVIWELKETPSWD